jgi:hypothetical protein
VADFLLHLHVDEEFAMGTINGYVSSLSHTLRALSGVEIGCNRTIKALLRNIQSNIGSTYVPEPQWNLALVLQALTRAPFEPMSNATVQHLTWKTAFLVALASGKRRGEMHAFLASRVSFAENREFVSLSVGPQFLSKTHLHNRGSPSLVRAVILSLSPSLSPEMVEDKTLCPVRALRWYIDKTKDMRKGKKLLFVSVLPGHKGDIRPATLSGWIKNTILLAYRSVTDEIANLHGVRAHDVRSMGTSLAFHQQASMAEILKAGTWKSHNTFTRFYLKDMTVVEGDLRRLGPIVAAEHLCQF